MTPPLMRKLDNEPITVKQQSLKDDTCSFKERLNFFNEHHSSITTAVLLDKIDL